MAVGAKPNFYRRVRWPHFRGSDCMQVYGDGVLDQAKCPHYHRCPLFRGVRKAGFHCTMYMHVDDLLEGLL